MSGRIRAALALLLLVVGGGGGLLVWRGLAAEPLTRTATVGELTVDLTIDPPEPGHRPVEIALRDAAGQPVVADRVVVVPTMAEMGHALPAAEATPIAASPGRYRVAEVDFFMAGEWEIDVAVGPTSPADTSPATARFTFSLG